MSDQRSPPEGPAKLTMGEALRLAKEMCDCESPCAGCEGRARYFPAIITDFRKALDKYQETLRYLREVIKPHGRTCLCGPCMFVRECDRVNTKAKL